SPYRRTYTWNNREKQKEVEERRVIYVGRLGEEVTKTSLRRRFEVFGTVMDVSIHFRENTDNYGFVTFERKEDAYKAVEHGNDNPLLPRYDLSFGGRRAFCKTRYADLEPICQTDCHFCEINLLKIADDKTRTYIIRKNWSEFATVHGINKTFQLNLRREIRRYRSSSSICFFMHLGTTIFAYELL
ncbi:peroxisome proliferator-activated receptor gamma coactivator 1-alpha, partial [Pseudomyrmex gracilis]|uniref:peroxisome proliferator-activated receptor gamma coactivator 1-alpha n=1 Tax=Pseudomyrmex gracilis TaxID=219809 RepID=UPI00099515EA